jgi:hypothetical protein
MTITTDSQAVEYLAKALGNYDGALAIVDVLRAESGLDPTALNPAEGAYGIGQWTEGRKTRLAAFAEQVKEPADTLQLQLRYLVWETKNYYADVWQSMQKVTSIPAGIHIWVADWEIPASDALVEGRAEHEAGLPFGPAPGAGSGLVQSSSVSVTNQPDPRDRTPKIRAAGKRLSASGTSFEGHTRALRDTLAATVKL